MDEKQAQIIVDKIINELCDRCGFDNWWDDLDRDIREEIKDKLSEIIANG